MHRADQAGTRWDTYRRTTWAPVVQTPVVEATGARFSNNLISAVSPGAEVYIWLAERAFTSAGFACCSARIAAYRPTEQQALLTVAGHPMQRAWRVQHQLEARVRLFFPAPYSPQSIPTRGGWGM